MSELGGPDYDPLKGIPDADFEPANLLKALERWYNVASHVLREDVPLELQMRMTAELLLEQAELWVVIA
jgi:hypothetical protein